MPGVFPLVVHYLPVIPIIVSCPRNMRWATPFMVIVSYRPTPKVTATPFHKKRINRKGPIRRYSAIHFGFRSRMP